VTRKGSDIREYPFSEKGVDTGIGYGMLYKEYEACVEAGLSLEKWFNGDYGLKFMAKTVAWWQLRKLIAGHTSDAESAAIKAKTRK
jgi:hypothetical protein